MSLNRSSSNPNFPPIWDSADPARNPPPLPLPKSPQDKELAPLPPHLSPESPSKYARHSRAESVKLDHLARSGAIRHSPSASLSRMSTSSGSNISPIISHSYISASQHDVSSMADQLNSISSTTTSILTTLQTLMRRSKDNATELDNLRKQVVESKEQETQTVDEIRRLVSSTHSMRDLTALYAKLDSLRPVTPPPPPPPLLPPSFAHKLEEEKVVVEAILNNADSALNHLLTLTESINNLNTLLQSATTRLTTEECRLESLLHRKSAAEAEVARLEATIHLRNLELAAFTRKADILESRIIRAKTAVQLSGSKQVKMKKSPLISSKPSSHTVKEGSATPITPQRRILSLSSTNNKDPAKMVADHSNGTARKTSWSKKIGGMLSNLTNSNNKENAGEAETVKNEKRYTLEPASFEKDGSGLVVPPATARGRSVSERTSAY